MQPETFLIIRSELEPQGAQDAVSSSAKQISNSGPMRVEFDAPRANIFALQIAVAARRSLELKGAFLGFGPIASADLGSLWKENVQELG